MSQQVNGPRPSDTTVMARYQGMSEARRAFNALQNHGVDASDIRLAGYEAEASRQRAEAPGAFEGVDERTVRHLGPRVVLGGAVGGVLGAALGLAVGAAIAGIVDVDATVALFALTTLVLAALGSALGVFITFERSVGYDDTWELTLDESGGGVWIAVRVRGDGEGSQVLRALERDAPSLSVEVRETIPEGMHTVRW